MRMTRGQLVVQGRGTRVSPPLQLFLPHPLPPPSLQHLKLLSSLCFNQFKLRRAKAAQGRVYEVDWWSSAVLHAGQEEEEEEGLGGNFACLLTGSSLPVPLTIICTLNLHVCCHYICIDLMSCGSNALMAVKHFGQGVKKIGREVNWPNLFCDNSFCNFLVCFF